MPSAKQNAIDLYMGAIRDGNPRETLDKTIGARYTQHSTGVRNGKEGFLEFFEPFLERNPVRDMKIVRALQDGPKVFVHCYQNLNDGAAEWVTTDFFDSDEEGRIVEHWDVIAAYAPSNPSGRSNIDGATEITDLDKTDANRALIEDFIQTCLIAGDAARLPDYVNGDEYIQHNPEVGDGLAHFQGLLADPDRKLTYQENFMTVAEGNFVATLNRARWGEQDLCQCDLFRVDDGRIAEHWDNSEPGPPREDWVNGGKF